MAEHHGPSGWGIFFILLFVFLIVGGIAYIIFTQLRARRLGLPSPSYNPFANRNSSNRGLSSSGGGGGGESGPIAWIKTKFSGLRNRRTTAGGYEEPLSAGGGGGRGRRGFGPLDPDEAWDARVGTEADAYGPGGYYEEQELGLHAPPSTSGNAAAYGDGAYGGPAELPEYGEESSRGRSRSREAGLGYVGGSKGGLDARYDAEMGRGGGHNPFGDGAERSDISMRGVSPRPIDTGVGGGAGLGYKEGHTDDSPTERRSMFREQM
ncbi:MAG: hypothetical protein M1812_002486 [Candelaria pacifica]|nr:MAG: hypothetical protein M1812_002486 [Candelaria pacifica]